MLRTDSALCLLCQSSPATKRNSHIIPDFFSATIFTNSSKRRVWQVGPHGKKPKQTTPKEHYILCPDCEERFSGLEKVFNDLFYQIFKQFTLREEIPPSHDELKGNLVMALPSHSSDIFLLFAFSLFWRASVSEDPTFSHLKLPEHEEELLRSLLNTCTHRSKSIIESTLTSYTTHIPFNLKVCTHLKGNKETEKIIVGWNYNQDSYSLYCGDFFMVLDKTRTQYGNYLQGATNFIYFEAITEDKWNKRVTESIADFNLINSNF